MSISHYEVRNIFGEVKGKFQTIDIAKNEFFALKLKYYAAFELYAVDALGNSERIG